MDLEAVKCVLTEPWGRTISRGYSPATKELVEVQEFLCPSQEQADCYLSELRKIGEITDERTLCPILAVDFVAERQVARVFVPHSRLTLAQFLANETTLDEEQRIAILTSLAAGLERCRKANVVVREINSQAITVAEDGFFRFARFLPHYPAVTSEYYAPLLNYYVKARSNPNASFVSTHNPYKSEVFSLGVVALDLFGLPKLEAPEVFSCIQSSAWSPWLQQVLCWMLAGDEDERCDPADLLTALRGSRKPLKRLPKSRPTRRELVRLGPGDEGETFHVQLLCLGCMQTFLRSRDSVDIGDAIKLGCGEGKHIFCEVDCLLRFALRGNCATSLAGAICPFCISPFPAGITAKFGDLIREKCEALSKFSRKTLGKDVLAIRCAYCYQESTGGIQIHANSTHFFCSSACVRTYIIVDCKANSVDFPCPSVGCQFQLLKALVIDSFGDEKTLKTTWKSTEQRRLQSQRCSKSEITPTGPCLHCCSCSSSVDLNAVYRLGESERPLFLSCEPPTHAFCSTACLRNYVELATQNFELDFSAVICPLCHTPIDHSIIEAAYNGKELLTIRQRSFKQTSEQLCLKCTKKSKIRLQCGHRYCRGCVRRWYKISISQRDVQVKCPACQKPVNYEAFARVMSKFEKVGQFFSSFWG